MIDKETITIPLNKVSYEDLEALTIEQQTQLFVKDKEIERLGNELQIQIEDNTRLNEYIESQDKKLQQKENIIKEVREELNKIDSATYQGDTDKKKYYKYEQTRIKKILETLDKVSDEK